MQHGDDLFLRMNPQQPVNRQPLQLPAQDSLGFRAGQYLGHHSHAKLPAGTDASDAGEQFFHECLCFITDDCGRRDFDGSCPLQSRANIAAACGDLRLIAKIVQNHLPPAAMRLRVLNHQVQFLERVIFQFLDALQIDGRRGRLAQLLLLPNLIDEKILRVLVIIRKQQHAPRRQPIPTGSPRFLVIRFQRAGKIEMNHAAHIRLVDPHSKRVGGHRDHRLLGRHERLLAPHPIGHLHPGVIRHHRALRLRLTQIGGHFIDGLPRRTVNNPAPLDCLQQAHQLAQLLLLGQLNRFVTKIWPIKSRDKNIRPAQAELLDDLASHFLGGGRGKSDGRRLAEYFAHLAQPCIFRPKIVPPGADAVGFIDRQQLRPQLRQTRRKTWLRESLRRDIQ